MTTKIWSKFYDLYTMYNIEPEIFGKGGVLQLVPTTMTHTDHALYNCTYFTGLISWLVDYLQKNCKIGPLENFLL